MSRIPTQRSWPWSVLLLLLLVASCTQQQGREAPTGSPLPLAPIQSPNDGKAYRYIELDNGLRALLISDPDTEKAAASLDVYVGSASNPEDRGGLAHFLEHMLFLGTDKYPDSGEYATFISEHYALFRGKEGQVLHSTIGLARLCQAALLCLAS